MNRSRHTDQKAHWDLSFHRTPAFFGRDPSGFCAWSLPMLRAQGTRSLLELGCGQGRDTIALARAGLTVAAVDYANAAVADTRKEAVAEGVADLVETRVHDVRRRLPWPDVSFDACYAHMLLCMELTATEVAFILREIRRVLKPGGLVLYSVRSHFDPHYGKGIAHGDDLYEIGNFMVRFFSESDIRHLAAGFRIREITRLKEGRLPRDLFCVAMEKTSVPECGNPDFPVEAGMISPPEQHQVVSDAAPVSESDDDSDDT